MLSVCSSPQDGTTPLAIAKRWGYISVTDVLKVVTDETSVEVSPIPPCTPTSDTHSLQDAPGVPQKWSIWSSGFLREA